MSEHGSTAYGAFGVHRAIGPRRVVGSWIPEGLEQLLVDDPRRIEPDLDRLVDPRYASCSVIVIRPALSPCPRSVPRSSQPSPSCDPAGVGGMPEGLIIAFVLIGISVGKDAHRPVERVPGSEITADRDRVA